MNKYLRLCFCTLLTVMVASLSSSAIFKSQAYAAELEYWEYEGYEDYFDPNTFRVHLSIDGISTMHRTTSRYVGAFLAEHGVDMHPLDLLLTSYNRRIEDATMIRIVRAFYITLDIDGDISRKKISPGTTAGEVLNSLQEQFDDSLQFIGNRNEELTENFTLALTTTRTRTEIVTEEIPYTTYNIDNDAPLDGEIYVMQEGIPGERRIEYTIVSVSNRETSREVTAEYIIEPTPRIIRIIVDKPEVVEEEVVTIQSTQVNVYGVELIRWSEARELLPRNTPWQVTDVRSGRVYWVQSFSHGNHADVEPVDRESTDILFNVFGGRWCWEPRPVWVTVDGRTFAGSISAMPHSRTNNLDNGIIGHICLHFYGSRTHNGNRRHERDHQNAVQEAFRAASR